MEIIPTSGIHICFNYVDTSDENNFYVIITTPLKFISWYNFNMPVPMPGTFCLFVFFLAQYVSFYGDACCKIKSGNLSYQRYQKK